LEDCRIAHGTLSESQKIDIKLDRLKRSVQSFSKDVRSGKAKWTHTKEDVSAVD
jgi:hypothetical protein